MDPDVCLSEMMTLALRISKRSDEDIPQSEFDASELAERVVALNDWIVKGGFLPEAWRTQDGPKS